MATGADVKQISSEETYDNNCSVCRRRDRVNEAVKYCQECRKYLCTSCLDHHFDYNEDHTLVEPSAAGTGDVMPTEKCRRHHQRLVELWCKKHDEVLCTMCAFLEHRHCEDVRIITDNTDSLLQGDELQDTIDGLEKVRERLAILRNGRNLTGQDLLDEKQNYLEMVDVQERKVIKKVESIRQTVVEEISDWYNDSKKKKREAQDSCDHLSSDASTCLQQLDASSENKPQLFVSMKKGQKVLKSAVGFATLKENEKPDQIYIINCQLVDYLPPLKILGSFQKLNCVYKRGNLKRISIKTADDPDTSNIFGTCLLYDGSILMTDYSNKRLKRLNNCVYDAIDQCDLPGPPWGVCCVGLHEVAVSLCSIHTVQFVSVGKTMTLTRSFAVDHNCRGIGYSDGELFVSDHKNTVYVYNMSGTLLRTISQSPSGEEMFSNSRHLAVSGSGVFIADMQRGCICTDKNGTELFRYMGTRITSGCGVCTDGQGGGFLCDFNSNNVFQIGEDGQELGVVLTRADGVINPHSVCFIQSKQKLIVTIKKSEDILVFDLI